MHKHHANDGNRFHPLDFQNALLRSRFCFTHLLSAGFRKFVFFRTERSKNPLRIVIPQGNRDAKRKFAVSVLSCSESLSVECNSDEMVIAGMADPYF